MKGWGLRLGIKHQVTYLLTRFANTATHLLLLKRRVLSLLLHNLLHACLMLLLKLADSVLMLSLTSLQLTLLHLHLSSQLGHLEWSEHKVTTLQLAPLHLYLSLQLGHLGWSEHMVITRIQSDTFPACSSAPLPVLAAGTPGVVRRTQGHYSCGA